MAKIITALALMIFSSGCVRENLYLCPDWGKYRVLFYDKTQNRDRLNYNVVIQERSASLAYTRTPDTTQLKSGNVLKLYPGNYLFNALLSTTKLEVSKRPGMKNGYQYLFADTSVKIVKAGINQVKLDFKLANSLIAVKCNFD